MAKIIKARMTAHIEGEFCVFLIGMRVNRLWKIHKWLPVARAMFAMLQELEQDRDAGLLGYETLVAWPPFIVQYWRSFEALETYAKSQDRQHRPAWAEFNRRIASNGDVGIWHETYRVAPGQWECVYNNMPPWGLGRATSLVPASGRRETAAGRLAVTAAEQTAGRS